MVRYLITGRGGTGKSTICLELQRLGYTAIDADKVLGLCRWEDRQTGEPIDVDPSGYIDSKKVAWVWQYEVLKQLFKKHDNLILCGSSSNQTDYYNLFDKIFVLTIDEKTHEHRLKTRDFDYGKNPRLQREIIARHQDFAKKMVDEGATPIDVTKPLEKVMDSILEHVDIRADDQERSGS